jgi:outer membrane protein assembly factor BamE (lipoprotein component of BamABCDE complex)
MFKQKIILSVLACCFLNTCSGIKVNNGYMPVQDSVDQLKVNKTSLSFAKSRLGEPALILGNQEPIFIYSSQVTNRVLFFEPKVISRDVLVLYFNKKKRLKKLEKFNLKDGKSFQMNTGTTTLNAEQRSLIATLFSNIGVGGVRIPD